MTPDDWLGTFILAAFVLNIILAIPSKCRTCKGLGWHSSLYGPNIKCPKCNGRGKRSTYLLA